MKSPNRPKPTHVGELFEVLKALALGKPSPVAEVPGLELVISTYTMRGVYAVFRDPRDQQRYHLYLLPEQTVQLIGENWHGRTEKEPA